MPKRRPDRDWNPDTSIRDPRVDPRFGDVLGIGRVRFYVIRSWEPSEVTFTHRQPWIGRDGWTRINVYHTTTLAKWRRVNRSLSGLVVYNVSPVRP